VLDALARRDARLLAGRLQLVDLVDEDDAAPRLLDVAACPVDQPLEDRLDLVADETRLRERGRLGGRRGCATASRR
jgi:hypothetical protein